MSFHLDSIRVVLVEPSHPGNIGAAARAMKTMGLTRLVLVNPLRFPHAEATAMASGADDLLHTARVVTDLNSALTDCGLVIGTTARSRGVAGPELDPRACAARAVEAVAAAPVALVFGRERTGLTNEEVDRCHYRLRIPANPGYSSLNLAAAVQVVCYELRMALAASEPSLPADPAPAPFEELERFYEHLQAVLLETGFLDPDNPRHLMRRLRRLFNRARPDQREINILRGILSAVQGGKPARRD